MVYDRLICNFVSILCFSQVLHIILAWICPPRIIKSPTLSNIVQLRQFDAYIHQVVEYILTVLYKVRGLLDRIKITLCVLAPQNPPECYNISWMSYITHR